MRELRFGLNAPAVGHWQEFLRDFKPEGRNAGFYAGAIDNAFDYKLWKSTRAYQGWLLANAGKPIKVEQKGKTHSYRIETSFRFDAREYRIQCHGKVDVATTLAARRQGFKPEPEFKMGPDVDVCRDLRESRPYFLVPLPEPPPELDHKPNDGVERNEDAAPDQQQERIELRRRIRAWIRSAYAPPAGDQPRVTDLYIFSHGWHRNFYQAVSAYDRLSSRIARLLRSGRFDKDSFLSSDHEDFRPLYLNLHWHSDPGEDDFLDRSGRRAKSDFLRRVRDAFEPKERSADAGIRMTKVFEDIFALFSRMAAPDTKALSDRDIKHKAADLFEELDNYQLKDIPDIGSPDRPVSANRAAKTAIAWTCYHESDCLQVLLDQDEKPSLFITPGNAFLTAGRFLGGLVGAALIATLLTKISKWLKWPPPLSRIFPWPPLPQLVLHAALVLFLLIFFLLLTGISYRHGDVPGARLDDGDPGCLEDKNKLALMRYVRRVWVAVIFFMLSIFSVAIAKAVTVFPTKLYEWWPRRSADITHYFHILYLYHKAIHLLDYSMFLAGILSMVTLICAIVLYLFAKRRRRPKSFR